MGWRFTRYLAHLSEEDQYNYSQLSNPKKRKFRQSYAEGEWGDYQKKRHHIQTTSETTRKVGRMLNYDAILKAEGGRHSPQAVWGTRNIIRACLERGAGWCEIDEYSKRMTFRYIQQSYEQTHTDEWRITQEERARLAPPAAAPAIEPAGEPARPVWAEAPCVPSAAAGAAQQAAAAPAGTHQQVAAQAGAAAARLPPAAEAPSSATSPQPFQTPHARESQPAEVSPDKAAISQGSQDGCAKGAAPPCQ
eukprot:9470448-Pyramimonas_sp.AAC.1